MMGRKIKIFVDAHVFDIHRQGTTTYVAGLYNALLRYEDLEIHFGVHNVEALKKEIPAARHIIPYARRGFVARYLTEVPDILRQYSFDFAHFQYIVPFRGTKTRYITTVHDVLFMDYPGYFSLPFRLSRRLLFGWSLRRSAVKLTVSEYSRSRISHHFGIPAEDIQVTANAGPEWTPGEKMGSRAYVREKYGVKKYILYVSRIEPRKNHRLLLDAFVQLKLDREGYNLLFVGKADDESSAVNEYIQAQKIKCPALHQLVDVPYEDLCHLYNGAELFVFPSLAEGFGIPPLEAAACSVPVLCSRATAMGDFDFFAEGLFDPEEEGSLGAKLREVLLEKKLTLPETLAPVVKKQYNWERSAAVLHKQILRQQEQGG